MDDDWDDLDLDDWSETEDSDSSDTWDDFDDESDWDAEDDDAEDAADLDGFDDGWDEAEDAEAADAGAAGTLRLHGATGRDAGRPSMSALEFGVAAGVAGWLLDQQADRIVEGIRRASLPPAAAAPAWQRLAPIDAPPGTPPVRPGDRLTIGGLTAVLRQRLATGQELALEALLAGAAAPAHPEATTFTVVLSHLVADERRIWVLFPERAGGFSMPLLQPVFADQGPPGVACCFVDSAEAATAVVAWGLRRYGLVPERFRWSGGF
jgi:hypothetical protein